MMLLSSEHVKSLFSVLCDTYKSEFCRLINGCDTYKNSVPDPPDPRVFSLPDPDPSIIVQK